MENYKLSTAVTNDLVTIYKFYLVILKKDFDILF